MSGFWKTSSSTVEINYHLLFDKYKKILGHYKIKTTKTNQEWLMPKQGLLGVNPTYRWCHVDLSQWQL